MFLPLYSVKEGSHTIFTIQTCKTHESEWCKPDGPLIPVPKMKWGYISEDHFGYTAEPWIGSGNDYRPKFRDTSYAEYREVLHSFGVPGWFTEKYAKYGVVRLRKANKLGKFDCRDGYGKVHQAVSYDFRVVKINIVHQWDVEVVD